MKPPFLEAIQERILLADGGIGTEIYARGVFFNRCYDEINLSDPRLIAEIHQDYLRAGADLIETNTFGANRLRLAAYGLEDKVADINRRGVEIALEAAQGRAYVAGAMGPLGKSLKPLGLISKEDAGQAFEEQIEALIESGVDLLILETFSSLEELEIAFRAARALSDIPIVTQMSFHYFGEEKFSGVTPEQAVKAMESWGVDVGGTNCGNGPQGVLACVERMRAASSIKLSAMPNAGLPEMVGNRTLYLATPEYMGEYARRFAQQGISLIGGCCGTTPAQIKEMSSFLRSVTKVKTVTVSAPVHGSAEKLQITPAKTEDKSPFGAKLGKKFMVSVELDPPKGLNPEKAIAGARFLHKHGIDVVNIADGPRAIARMSPMGLAVLVRQQVEMETIIHYCCRDRNLLGMQMDLIAANALGLKNILCITGDPPKMGNYPNATAVFDVDAIGLIGLVSRLNRGIDLGGGFMGEATSLVIGAGCNPGAINLDLEVERYQKKIEAGAEFIFSQPVYDPQLLEVFLKRTEHVPRVPFFVGILPLASYKNAEFFHNEVPGMQIPDEVMERMRRAGSRDEQHQEGIRVARETLAAARTLPRIQGVYIYPPFGKYEAILDVIEGII